MASDPPSPFVPNEDCMTSITALDVVDIRFPTSRWLDGSDAMNPEPDYSAAYLVLRTDDPDVAGYSLLFTTGRGNDVACAAVRSLTPYVLGRQVATLIADIGALARELTWDGQLRWLGPEKGVMHMAIGAVVNAAWDLRARADRQPLWQVLSSLTPAEIVHQIDFTYIDDALSPADAIELLEAAAGGRADRIAALEADGLPAYTTSAGWLGYDDDKVERLTKQAIAEGFTMLKLKVGADVESDVRRMQIARIAAGAGVRIAVDANQRWGVGRAIEWMARLAPFDPYWIEEPTSPDDVLGHRTIRQAVRPIRVATGEHVQNRVIFKQLLQAEAIDVVQIDACRVGGVNENLAILLLAAKFGVPVCPHAGGVGLCEMVQHLAMFDFVAVSGTTDHRWVEYVDHLHEHFVEPVVVEQGRYRAPHSPGAGARMLDSSIAQFRFPDGPAWATPGA
jgi:L-fuconate dehydratase